MRSMIDAQRWRGATPQRIAAPLACCETRASWLAGARVDDVDVDAASRVPVPRVERRGDARRQRLVAARGPRELERVGQARGGAQRADELGVECGRLAVAAECRPVHEVPEGQVGDQIVRVELALEPGQGALDGGEDRLDHLEIAGVQPVLLGVEDPLQRPVGNQDGVGVVVAGREHLGEAIGPLTLGCVAQKLAVERVDAGPERNLADEKLDRRVAEPLALFAARAVLPAVVHAEQQRVAADLPQPRQQRVGAGEGAARLGGVVREGGAEVADAQPVRRVAHGDLRVADGRPLEALEALRAGPRRVAEYLRRRRLTLDDARLRRRRVVPLAGHAFGDGDLDHLAAAGVELDERIARVDAAEVEHDRYVEVARCARWWRRSSARSSASGSLTRPAGSATSSSW